MLILLPIRPTASKDSSAIFPAKNHESKTIGIIGGMGWPSSEAYYKLCNQLVSDRLGPLHCANLVLIQTDFDKINAWEAAGRWDLFGNLLVSLAQRLVGAGADMIMIACNTAHKTLPHIRSRISLPIVDIVEVTSLRVKHLGFKTVGFLGTIYTMEDDYFRGPLLNEYGITAITPNRKQREMIQEILEKEVVRGSMSETSKAKFRVIIHDLVSSGAEAIVLACTEFGQHLRAEDSTVPMVDTLTEHAKAAVERALA
ncbi:hypothetical protein LMH87_006719 [Akanthomyces muscarius]|uniref:Aspartate racemase n=1 Tax=Akanthomyces muscarius TaxID=2231603 RepID=A0A9W8QRF6_AKAMU|nr:hypothetical protein LMH87_006719 [Akanthomyces muscarius]KAJ4165072.1 hypothetical protein LMH87_006719 [Akanthomyces muscarius]